MLNLDEQDEDEAGGIETNLLLQIEAVRSQQREREEQKEKEEHEFFFGRVSRNTVINFLPANIE